MVNTTTTDWGTLISHQVYCYCYWCCYHCVFFIAPSFICYFKLKIIFPNFQTYVLEKTGGKWTPHKSYANAWNAVWLLVCFCNFILNVRMYGRCCRAFVQCHRLNFRLSTLSISIVPIKWVCETKSIHLHYHTHFLFVEIFHPQPCCSMTSTFKWEVTVKGATAEHRNLVLTSIFKYD